MVTSCGIDADSQGQSQDRDNGKTAVADQGAQGVSKIIPERFHTSSRPDFTKIMQEVFRRSRSGL